MVLSEIKSFLFKDTPAFALGKIFFLYVVLPAENCNKCKCLKQINCKVFAGYAYSRMYCCVWLPHAYENWQSVVYELEGTRACFCK